MGRLLLVLTWIPSALLSIFASIFLLHYLTHVRDADVLLHMQTQALLPRNELQFFASLPEVLGAFSSSISTGDARTEIVRAFLRKYNSPLADHAETIIEAADTYNLDYRLIPSIAMQESTGCKYVPYESNNCWGFGIYGDKVLHFETYDDGINQVSKTLREKYLDQGLTTPVDIMSKYTPSSNGSWAAGVEYFMEQMQ